MKVSAVVGLISIAFAQDLPTIPVGTYHLCGLQDVPINYPKSCPATDCCGIATVNNVANSKICGPRYSWNVSTADGVTTIISSGVSTLTIGAKLASMI